MKAIAVFLIMCYCTSLTSGSTPGGDDQMPPDSGKKKRAHARPFNACHDGTQYRTKANNQRQLPQLKKLPS